MWKMRFGLEDKKYTFWIKGKEEEVLTWLRWVNRFFQFLSCLFYSFLFDTKSFSHISCLSSVAAEYDDAGEAFDAVV